MNADQLAKEIRYLHDTGAYPHAVGITRGDLLANAVTLLGDVQQYLPTIIEILTKLKGLTG